MKADEIRQKFLKFFETKRHVIVPSASIIPEDKTVLFITAGMQPLVPHLMGVREHPEGPRLANSQKCLRTDDIMEVGDSHHLTFFEMLGNWSIGDYFKKEAIEWSFELLTSKDWFGIPPEKLFVTVFEGDKKMGVGKDDESIGIWWEVFALAGVKADSGDRIFAYPKEKNWWELAGPGPCGPDTEIFYFTGKEHDLSFGAECHVNCDCGRFVEIWNNVFMEYEKKITNQKSQIKNVPILSSILDKVGTNQKSKLEEDENTKKEYEYIKLKQRNVDTGMGFERIVMVLQGKSTVFETDLFLPVINLLEALSQKNYLEETRSFRIIADHMRASAFLIAEGILPSNVEKGYILRRLIRRSIVHARKLSLPLQYVTETFSAVGKIYKDVYPKIINKQGDITGVYLAEAEKFTSALERGAKEFGRLKEEKIKSGQKIISGGEAFKLYETFGFPLDMILDMAKEVGLEVDEREFDAAFTKHQEISRAGAEKKFGGHGLIVQTGELKAADEEGLKKATRLHTATHLLQAALRQVLGEHVRQKGSDITAERLRFDFSHPQKMTDGEKKKVEDLVNEQIQKGLLVKMEEMLIENAEKSGALMFQKEKYKGVVKVYSIGNFSKELCGGPHVANTKEIGRFKILKEEASSAGVRRIRATVE